MVCAVGSVGDSEVSLLIHFFLGLSVSVAAQRLRALYMEEQLLKAFIRSWSKPLGSVEAGITQSLWGQAARAASRPHWGQETGQNWDTYMQWRTKKDYRHTTEYESITMITVKKNTAVKRLWVAVLYVLYMTILYCTRKEVSRISHLVYIQKFQISSYFDNWSKISHIYWIQCCQMGIVSVFLCHVWL